MGLPHTGQQHGKFVTTQPGHIANRLGADSHQMCHMAQHPVPHVAGGCRIHHPQVIQIGKQQTPLCRHGRLRLPALWLCLRAV